MDPSSAALRQLLGDAYPTDAAPDAAAWADGYGIVSPEVSRHLALYGGMPDALALAMRNVAGRSGLTVVDRDTAVLIGTLVRGAARVLEAGTGSGYLTLHLARSIDPGGTVVSAEVEPDLQAAAHEFLRHELSGGAVELRLGEPATVLRHEGGEAWADAVVLTDPGPGRLLALEALVGELAPGGLLVVPWALRGGRAAAAGRDFADRPEVGMQRTCNRTVIADPRLTDIVVLPVGDGLLLARRAS